MLAEPNIQKPLSSSLPLPLLTIPLKPKWPSNPFILPLFQLTVLFVLPLSSVQCAPDISFSLLIDNRFTIFHPRFLGPEVCYNSELFRFRRYYGTYTIYSVKYSVENGNINPLIFLGENICRFPLSSFLTWVLTKFYCKWVLAPNLERKKNQFSKLLSVFWNYRQGAVDLCIFRDMQFISLFSFTPTDSPNFHLGTFFFYLKNTPVFPQKEKLLVMNSPNSCLKVYLVISVCFMITSSPNITRYFWMNIRHCLWKLTQTIWCLG